MKKRRMIGILTIALIILAIAWLINYLPIYVGLVSNLALLVIILIFIILGIIKLLKWSFK